MSDEEIMELYFQRDESAVLHTERKYGAYLKTIAKNILGDRRDAEEVLNDCCLRAWNTIPPEKPKSLSAYLARIARNMSLDRFRSRRATKRKCEAELIIQELDECIPGGTRPENVLESKELSDAINSFLASLPQESRVLMVRRYWYSESVKGIAASLNRTPGAVAMQLKRLREELRKYLKERSFNV